MKSQNGKNPEKLLNQLAENHFQTIHNANNTKSVPIKTKNNKRRKNNKEYSSSQENSINFEIIDEKSLVTLDEKKLDLAIEVWMDKKKGKKNTNTYFKASKYIKKENIDDENGSTELKSTEITSDKMEMQEFSKRWDRKSFHSIWKPQEVILSGLKVDDNSFRTLINEKCIDDIIIDAFSSVCSSTFPDISLLNYSVHHVRSLISENCNTEYCIKWCQKIRAKNYDAWLLPVHDTEVHETGHWTLLLVVFNHKYILYFDIMGSTPQENWISRICSLIKQIFCHKTKEFFQWSEWTLFSSKDVPK